MSSETLQNGAPRALPTAADGSPRLPHVAYDDDGYPYSDGAPLAQNSPSATRSSTPSPRSCALLRRRFPGAFAAADMLVYPRQPDLSASVAPGVFVAFGAGDHARNSYKLWEGEPVPAFVLEVLSGTTSDNDLGPKRAAYARMGVQELWLFDPFERRIAGHIAGYRLVAGQYERIERLPDKEADPSDVLCLELRAEGDDLRIHDPMAREDLLGYEEEQAGRLAERQRRLDERRGRLVAERRAEEEAAARRTAEAEIARLRAALDR